MFSVLDRKAMIAHTLYDEIKETKISSIKVDSFNGLLIDYAKDEGATILVRGIRSVSDFDYEINLANINKVLAPQIETVFLPTSPELAVVSSSMIKEIAKHGGDISRFTSPNVVDKIKKQFGFVKTGDPLAEK